MTDTTDRIELQQNTTIRVAHPATILTIEGKDGRKLLVIHSDGTVVGSIENAGEAAVRFMEAIGLNVTASAEHDAEVWDEGHLQALANNARPLERKGNPYRIKQIP